jgi:glycine/D-amino acid oxidase-like deaminating enzyme
MHVAIIGAGFSGLAVAWYLLESHPDLHLTLFDSKGIGGGTSGMAAGLLHPFSGAHAKLNRMGREGMEATLDLLQVASRALERPLFSSQPILRLALTSNQLNDFYACSEKYPADVEWLSSEKCQSLIPGITQAPGLLIHSAYTVQSSYLDGLWQACKGKGAQLEKQTIENLNDLKEFDLQIIATGAETKQFPECSHLSLTNVKGQILELQWPQELAPLPFPLNSHGYLLMNENRQTCLAGSTFEKQAIDSHPNIEIAKQDILPKVIAMMPALQSASIMNCYAGLRAVTPNHLPLIERIGEKQWVITGMGSKGLLYHALMAKRLAEAIFP